MGWRWVGMKKKTKEDEWVAPKEERASGNATGGRREEK